MTETLFSLWGGHYALLAALWFFGPRAIEFSKAVAYFNLGSAALHGFFGLKSYGRASGLSRAPFLSSAAVFLVFGALGLSDRVVDADVLVKIVALVAVVSGILGSVMVRDFFKLAQGNTRFAAIYPEQSSLNQSRPSVQVLANQIIPQHPPRTGRQAARS